MPRIVRCSIIQASNAVPATEPLARQKEAMIEKHLELIRKAASDGAQIVCLSTGGTLKEHAMSDGNPFITLPTGYQPRAALAHSFVPVLLVLEHIGLCAPQRTHVNEAAEILKSLAKKYGTDNLKDANDALRLAGIVREKLPVIYSDCELVDTVNLRWRGQIQENAKHVAFGNLLPEMNHNEINGWAHPAGRQQEFVVIFLRSPQDEHPRVAKRFDILREVLKLNNIHIEERDAEGNSPLAQMFSLISLGDWLSYYIALLDGEDPSPVPVIQLLKSKLAG